MATPMRRKFIVGIPIYLLLLLRLGGVIGPVGTFVLLPSAAILSAAFLMSFGSRTRPQMIRAVGVWMIAVGMNTSTIFLILKWEGFALISTVITIVGVITALTGHARR